MNNRTQKIYETAKEYSFLQKIPIIYRMLKSWKNGLYKPSLKNRIIIILSFIYIISPIDIFPEAVFQIFGIVDDMAVIMLLFGKLNEEINSFISWEKTNKTQKQYQDAVVIEEH